MAAIGPTVMHLHLPRTAGRAIDRMLSTAGLADRLSGVANHQAWSDLRNLHGPRQVMFGVFRDPADWYAAMVTSSLQSHKDWLAPYIDAVGTHPPELVAAMADPAGAGVKRHIPRDPDEEILDFEPGWSLLTSLYVRQFMRPGSRGRSVAELDAHHDEHIGLTHLVRFESLMLGLHELFPGLQEQRYREETPVVPAYEVYSGWAGAKALRVVQHADAWLIRRYATAPPLVLFEQPPVPRVDSEVS